MRWACWIAVLVPLLTLKGARAADLDRLADFTFEGVAMSSNVQAFKKKMPEAQLAAESSDAASGLECYAAGGMKSASEAWFHFLDGKLYRVTIRYDKARVQSLGGAGEVQGKLTAAFGPPDATDRGNAAAVVFRWQKPKLKRSASLVVTEEEALLDVVNTDAVIVVQKRKAKDTSLGF